MDIFHHFKYIAATGGSFELLRNRMCVCVYSFGQHDLENFVSAELMFKRRFFCCIIIKRESTSNIHKYLHIFVYICKYLQLVLLGTFRLENNTWPPKLVGEQKFPQFSQWFLSKIQTAT